MCLLSSLLAACDLGVTLGTRTMTEPLPVVTIPGAPLPVDLNLTLGVALDNPALDIDFGSEFVSFIFVRNLRLDILDASDRDSLEDGAEDSFDFVNALDVSIRADFDGVTNELFIATLPDGDPQLGTATRSLELTVVNNESDVFDYLIAPGGYEVVLNVIGSVPSDSIILSGEIRYRLGVGI